MFLQQMPHAVDGEPSRFVAGKQHATVTSLWFSQPGFQDGECRFSDGRTPFLATLADDSYVSADSDYEVLAFKPGHLG